MTHQWTMPARPMRMPRRFFELHDDVYVPGRWHLRVPIDAQGNEVDDPWQFTGGQPVNGPGRLRMLYDVPGNPLDFSLANLSIPVVSARVAELFTELAAHDVQLLPVEVEAQPDPYFILVAVHTLRCIDESASKIERWTPEDGIPEMVGQYASVRDLRVDEHLVGEVRVFRPEGWKIELIVSVEIKSALERIKATGVKFSEV